MRFVRVGLPVLVTLVLAGCGSQEQAASGPAEIAPASTPAFVSVNTNIDSGQWQQVEALLRKFPDGGALIRMVRSSFEGTTKLDWERDAKPALGDAIALIWLDFEGGGTNVVAVTNPKDEDRFRQALAKANASNDEDEELLVGEVAGWLVLSDLQAKIDRFREQAGSGGKLDDDQAFKDALAELPDESLVTAFARGENLTSAFQRALGGMTGGTVPRLPAGQRTEFVAAALAAQKEGMRFVAASRAEAEAAAQVQSYESKLLADVPSDAVAFLTFRSGSAFESQLRQVPREGLRQFEQMFGLRIDAITALFENEVALYLRPGTPFPEVTLLLEAPNEQEALRTVDNVSELLLRLDAAETCREPDEEQGGVTVRCVEVQNVRIRYAAIDGKVVVTTGREAFETRSGDWRLRDDEDFESARDASGLSEENAGFIWLDFEDGLPLVLGLADFADEQIPPEVRRNLEPLRSLVAWAEQGGPTTSAELFLAID